MNLSQIPKGDVVLVDANILIYAARHVSEQCDKMLERCAERDITCIIPSTQFAEVMHRLIIAEARDNGWISGPNPARQLAERPDRIRALFRYESALRSLLGLGMIVESIRREDFLTSVAVQRQSGLMTNDALFIACAERLRIQAVASADQRLAAARGVIVYTPDDINR